MVIDLRRKLLAELTGTALLLAVVIGSGIMGERLAGGNVAIALLANTLATVGGLYVLIEVFGPLSGAHFNPAVSVAMTLRGELPVWELLPYVAAQLIGALLGAWLAHAMFGLPIIETSTHARGTAGELVGEFVASFGLLGLVLSGRRHAPASLPYAIAAYITGAYWFTSSTSFANPAVAAARALTASFAGIAPEHVPGFILAELAGGAAALIVCGWLLDELIGAVEQG